MKKYLITLAFVGAAGYAQAVSIAIDFARPTGQNATTVFADYQAADANLLGTDADNFRQLSGNNPDPYNNLNTTLDGLTVTNTGTGDISGIGNAGNTAWNDLSPIYEGYAYVDTNNNPTVAPEVTISGLAALGAGQTITLTMYGVGDNIDQDSTFVSTFGANPTQTGRTEYNADAPTPRNDSTGFVGFVQHVYTSDGITDEISFTWARNTDSNRYIALNGFSVSVVPEPSSALLFGLGSLALLGRRRRV
ncbi:MAG: PEP-CTERM sorting domain-containing protein [Akkermansiaceae bacterium]